MAGNKPAELNTTPSAAILVSGGGSNLQAFIDAVVAEEITLELRVVLSNKADAKGLERARLAKIPTECVSHKDYAERQQFDQALLSALSPYAPDIIILAGFMRILTPLFIDCYAGRILNIHPSLLPKYPGLNTHQRALEAGDKTHGSTVHFVTEQLDGGPCVMQGPVPIRADDTPETLASRVLAVEHCIYPQVAALYAACRLQCKAGRAWLDDAPRIEPLQYRSRH